MLDRDARHAFINGYIDAMLWANTLEYGEDGYMTSTDSEPAEIRELVTWETLKDLVRDARAFMSYAESDLVEASWNRGREWDFLGHDFALTRAHHGTGFWDRGLGCVGDRLTRKAHTFGEQALFVDHETREVITL